MQKYIITSAPIEADDEFTVVVVPAGQVREKAEYYASFDIDTTAVTEIELARELGIPVYLDGKLKETNLTTFYKDVPEFAREKHEQTVIDSARITLPVERRKVKSLADLDISAMVAEGGVYVITALTGHGKSKIVANGACSHALSIGRKASMIAPLIAICKTFHTKMEEQTGKELGYYDTMAVADAGKPGVVTTINSSTKKSVAKMLAESDVVVFEEFYKTVANLAEADCFKGYRKAYWNQLSRTVGQTHAVFALDADINDDAINFILAAGRKPIVIEIEADYSHIDIEMVEWKQNFAEIKRAAEDGQKICIAADSKQMAEIIHKDLEEIPGKLLIHADNKGHDQQRQFLENPNDNLDGVNVLIYSPVMGSSISIEVNHFDRCFGYFSGVLIPMACVQMLRRIRTATKFEISVDAPKYIGRKMAERDVFDEDSGIDAIRDRNRYLRESICTSLEVTLRYLKFNVSNIFEDAKARSSGAEAEAKAKKVLNDQYMEVVLGAKLIDVAAAKKLLKCDTMTPEKLGMRDATLTMELCGEVTEDSVNFNWRGAGFKRMKLHEILAMSFEDCYYADAIEHKLHDADKNYFEETKKLLTNFLKVIGVEYTEADAISALSKIRQGATWNKLGITSLPRDGDMQGDMALRKTAKILKAMGYSKRKVQGADIYRVTAFGIVNDFVNYHLSKKEGLDQAA